MPLSKKRNRERMRAIRVQPKCNLDTRPSVQPNTLDNLRQLIKNIEHKEPVKPNLPIYNPAIHKPGDKVLVKRGNRFIPTIVPTLDADGHPMPD